MAEHFVIENSPRQAISSCRARGGEPQELTVTMTVDTLPAYALETDSDTPTISQAVAALEAELEAARKVLADLD